MTANERWRSGRPARSSRTTSFQWMPLWPALNECIASAGTTSGHTASTGVDPLGVDLLVMQHGLAIDLAGFGPAYWSPADRSLPPRRPAADRGYGSCSGPPARRTPDNVRPAAADGPRSRPAWVPRPCSPAAAARKARSAPRRDEHRDDEEREQPVGFTLQVAVDRPRRRTPTAGRSTPGTPATGRTASRRASRSWAAERPAACRDCW